MGFDEAAPIGGDGGTRVGKFTHPSAAPAWRPACGLDGRSGQRPEPAHDRSALRCRTVSADRGECDRRSRRSRLHQERPRVQRSLAACGRAVQRRSRGRRARSSCRGSRTTAPCTPRYPRGRRTGWSARAASTSARVFRASCARGPTLSMASTPSIRRRTVRARTGRRRGAMPARTTMPTSGRCACWRWSRARTGATGPTVVRAAASCSPVTRTSVCASSAKFPCGSIKAGGAPVLDPEGQSGYEFPGADPRRHTVYVADARSPGPGVEHGADVAPGAPR